MTRQPKWAKLFRIAFGLVLMVAICPRSTGTTALAWSDYRYFPETGHTVLGIFLDYWEENGGLMQQGYPISDQIQEVSDVDGKAYSVQYFERAEFESHREFFDTDYPNLHPPAVILLSLLGSLRYAQKYPYGAPNQKPNQSPGSVYFPQTGKRLGGSFLANWQQYGGLAQQGYPVSDELQERSEADGQLYTVQYFERSVMEWHPGNAPPNDVLLSLLGTFRYEAKYAEAIKSLGIPRMITPDMAGAVAAGHYIFYVRYDNRDRSSGDQNKAIYGYDLTENKEFFVVHTTSELANIATDGQYLVWSTYARGTSETSPQPVYLYDVKTGSTIQILTAITPTDWPDVSLDRGILYYGDSTPRHKGLFARNLASNHEQLISEDGHGPVASTGEVLWVSSHTDKDHITTSTLHLTSLENDIPNKVITETTQVTFGTYDVWGSNVVWSYQFYIVPQSVYLYSMDDKSTTLLSVTAIGPNVNGSKVVWAEGDFPIFPLTRESLFHGMWLASYDLNTRLVSTVVPKEEGSLYADDLLDKNTLMYSKSGGLFIRTLGCPCQP
jgi:hypothetical protein